jgi:hypothetical protein
VSARCAVAVQRVIACEAQIAAHARSDRRAVERVVVVVADHAPQLARSGARAPGTRLVAAADAAADTRQRHRSRVLLVQQRVGYKLSYVWTAFWWRTVRLMRVSRSNVVAIRR